MVEGERADKVGASCESDHSDPVVRPRLDELTGHFLDHIESVRARRPDRVILRHHGARDIEHQHDVDAARLHPLDRAAELGTRQRHDQAGHCPVDERRKHRARAGAAPLADGNNKLRRGKEDAGGAADLAAEQREQRQGQQRQQDPRIGKGERGSGSQQGKHSHAASFPCGGFDAPGVSGSPLLTNASAATIRASRCPAVASPCAYLR